MYARMQVLIRNIFVLLDIYRVKKYLKSNSIHTTEFIYTYVNFII